MKIHLFEESKRRKTYFFTKNKNHCLKLEYDPNFDFGKNSTSGAQLENINIHYRNNYKFSEQHKEITINEVPQSIRDILSFL